jgi:hypothetical protein
MVLMRVVLDRRVPEMSLVIPRSVTENEKIIQDLVLSERPDVKGAGGTTGSDKPLTFQGSEYAHAAQGLNKAIDRVEG